MWSDVCLERVIWGEVGMASQSRGSRREAGKGETDSEIEEVATVGGPGGRKKDPALGVKARSWRRVAQLSQE